MTSAQRIQFSRPVSTPGWGGDKARPYLTEADADILVNLDDRTVTLTPKRAGAQVLMVPLENVSAWEPPQPPSLTPRTSKAVSS
jgi:hypothetical protein